MFMIKITNRKFAFKKKRREFSKFIQTYRQYCRDGLAELIVYHFPYFRISANYYYVTTSMFQLATNWAVDVKKKNTIQKEK